MHGSLQPSPAAVAGAPARLEAAPRGMGLRGRLSPPAPVAGPKRPAPPPARWLLRSPGRTGGVDMGRLRQRCRGRRWPQRDGPMVGRALSQRRVGSGAAW
eukprot:scaffold1186_cov399-Prasinococcus_capsulatus_cf.AAC.14